MIKEEEKNKLMQPKNDLVFHVLFSRGREKITKAMLEENINLDIITKITGLSIERIKEFKEIKNI